MYYYNKHTNNKNIRHKHTSINGTVISKQTIHDKTYSRSEVIYFSNN